MEDKKFIETFDVDDWEVLTDTGWEDIVKVHKTIPYTIWEIHTKSFELKCADKHLVFNEDMFPTYVDELKVGDKIWTENGLEEVSSIDMHNEEDNMYDLELSDDSNHRYYTNGILSHNTITTAIYILWYAMAFDHKQILVCAQSKDAASENLEKIRLAYEYCPNFLKKGVIGSNKTTMEFDNGSKIFVRPSNSNAPRGLTPSIVYVDEFAFIGSQDSAEKGLEKQNEFFSALTPSLSSSKGSLFITSTPISETDLFYQLWNGAKTKIDEKGLDIPYDYMLKINGELYRDFHLFKTKDEAENFAKSIRNENTIVEVVEKSSVGYNGFQNQLVKWDVCPLKDKKWAETELKRVGEERFNREYNCLTGDTLINIMDENGNIRKVSLETLYNFY